MNRGMLQMSPVQQMLAANLSWPWNPNAISPPPPLPLPPTTPLPLYASASIMQLPYQQPSSLLISSAWNVNQEFSGSWSQLLLGDPVDEDEDNLNTKEMENLEHGVQIPSSNTSMAQVKSKVLGGGCVHSHRRGSQNQEMQTAAPSSQQIASFTSYSSNVLDFSNSRPEKQSSDRSPEYNSSGTGAAVKKAKVQVTSTGQSTFKV